MSQKLKQQQQKGWVEKVTTWQCDCRVASSRRNLINRHSQRCRQSRGAQCWKLKQNASCSKSSWSIFTFVVNWSIDCCCHHGCFRCCRVSLLSRRCWCCSLLTCCCHCIVAVKWFKRKLNLWCVRCAVLHAFQLCADFSPRDKEPKRLQCGDKRNPGMRINLSFPVHTQQHVSCSHNDCNKPIIAHLLALCDECAVWIWQQPTSLSDAPKPLSSTWWCADMQTTCSVLGENKGISSCRGCGMINFSDERRDCSMNKVVDVNAFNERSQSPSILLARFNV